MSDLPALPDLRALLAEADRPSASCTVPLKQSIRERIADLEAELSRIAEDAPRKRMGAASPMTEKAREIEALRAEAAASCLTFHFEAPTRAALEAARLGMEGRDDEDEFDLRLTAASCSRVTGPDGTDFPTRMEWSDFRDLRDRIGEPIYLATIKATSDRVFRRDWSVPFSPAASQILATAK
jgi:hypothetical protein